LYDINKSEKIKGSLRRTTLSHDQTNGLVHIKEDKEIENEPATYRLINSITKTCTKKYFNILKNSQRKILKTPR
jgi:hypothetical protein